MTCPAYSFCDPHNMRIQHKNYEIQIIDDLWLVIGSLHRSCIVTFSCSKLRFRSGKLLTRYPDIEKMRKQIKIPTQLLFFYSFWWFFFLWKYICVLVLLCVSSAQNCHRIMKFHTLSGRQFFIFSKYAFPFHIAYLKCQN